MIAASQTMDISDTFIWIDQGPILLTWFNLNLSMDK